MKKQYIFLGIGTIILVIFSSIYFYKKSQFEYVYPRKGDLIEAVYGLGKVKSNNRFEIKLGIITSVQNLFVREGDVVKKGQKLISFDQTTFSAPFDGVVTMVGFYEGETVPPQVPVLRIEDLSDKYIEVSLEQEGAMRVRKGQVAKAVFESLRSKSLDGKVLSIFPRNDEFITHIAVLNLDENILPGMTADVSVEIGQIKNAVLIPLKTIQDGVVTLKRDGSKEKVKVDVGHVDGIWAEIKGNSIEMTDQILVKKSVE